MARVSRIQLCRNRKRDRGSGEATEGLAAMSDRSLHLEASISTLLGRVDIVILYAVPLSKWVPVRSIGEHFCSGFSLRLEGVTSSGLVVPLPTGVAAAHALEPEP
jgi:hypothetical protein